jgi:hypothetical protein
MRTLIDLPPKLPRSGDVDFFGLWHTGTADGDVEMIVDRWWRQDRVYINRNAQLPAPPSESTQQPDPATATPGDLPAGTTAAEQKLAELAALLANSAPQ